jgi:hypothetical protein
MPNPTLESREVKNHKRNSTNGALLRGTQVHESQKEHSGLYNYLLRRMETNVTPFLYSDVAIGIKEAAKFFTPKEVAKNLGFGSDEEVKEQIRAKVCAVGAFMDGLDGHLAKDDDSMIKKFLISSRLFEKAMKHVDSIGVGRIDEVKRHGFRDYIDRHKKVVDEQLKKMSYKKVAELNKELQFKGGSVRFENVAGEKFLREHIRDINIQYYKYNTLALVGYTAGAFSVWGTVHYPQVQDGFAAASMFTTGGGTRALLISKEIKKHRELWKEAFREVYGTSI